jgi:hypothetical protein
MSRSFIGDYTIPVPICARLIELHRACDRIGLVKAGRIFIEKKSVLDPTTKDSLDVTLSLVPPELQQQYGVADYATELRRCADQYADEYPQLKAASVGLAEPPVIQHYRPGGGFKREHCERSHLGTATRVLAWMTYLNDVADAGGTRFIYQDATYEARAGRTLIWPSEFTHTHVGVVSPTQHKYIITGWFNFLK